MKAFFWKLYVKDPAKPEQADPKLNLWAKVEEAAITDDLLSSVVEAFHDKRAIVAPKSTGANEVIKVVGP